MKFNMNVRYSMFRLNSLIMAVPHTVRMARWWCPETVVAFILCASLHPTRLVLLLLPIVASLFCNSQQVACVAAGNTGLSFPYCVSWQNSQTGNNGAGLCTSPTDTTPQTPAKCTCDPDFAVPEICVVSPRVHIKSRSWVREGGVPIRPCPMCSSCPTW